MFDVKHSPVPVRGEKAQGVREVMALIPFDRMTRPGDYVEVPRGMVPDVQLFRNKVGERGEFSVRCRRGEDFIRVTLRGRP